MDDEIDSPDTEISVSKMEGYKYSLLTSPSNVLPYSLK